MAGQTFNPIKEEVDGKKAHAVIWTTETLQKAVEGIRVGKKLVANPFYDNNIKLTKGDLVFNMTDEEIVEWQKCRDDIIYFSNTYCKLMTPEGIQNVEMRDYQEDYLRHLEKNRLSIFLSCRQSGKCLSFLTKIKIKIDDTAYQSHPTIKKKIENWKSYIIDNNEYEIPMFELYNLYDNSLKWEIKYRLYKIYYNTNNESILNKIAFIDNEYKDTEQKLIKSHLVDGIKIWTDKGWTPAAYIHMTRPFQIYKLTFENGTVIECADEHIFYTPLMTTVWAKDLMVGDKLLSENGPLKINKIEILNSEISMCDITVLNDTESYYTNKVLSHNTTTSAIFLLHYILFNFDKNALVLGNKGLTAREILSKLKNIFYELPYFLKPGVYKWNESQIVLDNGCMCMAEATTKNSGISFTFHCVLADEFAHVEPNILDKFYNNLFPTITAAKARFIISSTQNGYNLFYRLYKAAEAHENEYAAFKVDWWQVPEWNPDKKCWEPRDEEWHKLQIANYGSEEAFNQQFGTSFDVSSNTLINPKSLKKFNDRSVEFVNHQLGNVLLDQYYFWHPNFYPLYGFKWQFPGERFLITIDLAEGSGGDYTVFNINRVTVKDNKPNFECVGYFRCNSADLTIVAKSLRSFCKSHLPMYRYLISVEANMYGDLFMKLIMDEIDENPYEMELFNEDSFIKYYNESGTKFNYCVKMDHKSKLRSCMSLKNDLERELYVNDSTVFNSELFNFSDQNGNGVYKASYGHDDMVMTEVQIELASETEAFKNMLEELKVESYKGQNKPDFDPNMEMNGNIYADMFGGLNGPEMTLYGDFGTTYNTRLQ